MSRATCLQAEVDEATGKISSLQIKYTADTGAVGYANSTGSALHTAPNVYDAEGWQMESAVVQTNTAVNTWARSPGERRLLRRAN